MRSVLGPRRLAGAVLEVSRNQGPAGFLALAAFMLDTKVINPKGVLGLTGLQQGLCVQKPRAKCWPPALLVLISITALILQLNPHSKGNLTVKNFIRKKETFYLSILTFSFLCLVCNY